MDDEEDLEQFLQGDDFLTEEERQEQHARERRLARKRRLQELEASSVLQEEAKPISSLAATSASQPILVHQLPPPQHEEPSDVPKQHNKDNQDEDKADPDDDGFDMFSTSVSPVNPRNGTSMKTAGGKGGAQKKNIMDQQQDWDDTEGYYKATIGETIHLDLPNTAGGDVQFRIAGVIGKGVFSTVLKCATESSNLSSPLLPPQVALKVIRHNDTMAKAALNEIRFLQRLTNACSPGIVTLLLPTDSAPLDYRGHTILVFPFMEFNLRDVLAKFGKGVGLSLAAVRSYFAQLLAACWQLKHHKIIHSDLKPDNILVSADYKSICLADFGSAVDMTESVEVAPYLVSRFYRAPEIILGLAPTYAIDLWSLAATAAELFLGRVLFQGSNNNDMLNVMMVHLGPCSNRLIRQHLVQTKRFPIASHFSAQVPYIFRRLTEDPVSHQPVYKNTALQIYTPTLQAKLLKAKSAKDSRSMVLQFADLLQKCLTMDPSKRIDCKMALQHDFFKDRSTQKS